MKFRRRVGAAVVIALLATSLPLSALAATDSQSTRTAEVAASPDAVTDPVAEVVVDRAPTRQTD